MSPVRTMLNGPTPVLFSMIWVARYSCESTSVGEGAIGSSIRSIGGLAISVLISTGGAITVAAYHLVGPGGGFVLDADGSFVVIGGDETFRPL